MGLGCGVVGLVVVFGYSVNVVVEVMMMVVKFLYIF